MNRIRLTSILLAFCLAMLTGETGRVPLDCGSPARLAFLAPVSTGVDNLTSQIAFTAPSDTDQALNDCCPTHLFPDSFVAFVDPCDPVATLTLLPPDQLGRGPPPSRIRCA